MGHDMMNKSFGLKWADSTKATVSPMGYKHIFTVTAALCAVESCYHSGDVLQLVRISFKLALFYAMRNFYLESLGFFHISVITLHRVIAGHLLVSPCCPKHGEEISSWPP